jgi:hypothetical protein
MGIGIPMLKTNDFTGKMSSSDQELFNSHEVLKLRWYSPNPAVIR